MTDRHFKIYALLPALYLAGCGALPTAPANYPADNGAVSEPRQREMSPASASLLEQSRLQQQSGNLAQAATTLERAVRIDPAEPAVWLELARLRYAEANWAQAEQMARKAHSLAAANSRVSAAALSVMADALIMQGRPAEAERLRQ
jgi:Tfp pilus assembly protein PilF